MLRLKFNKFSIIVFALSLLSISASYGQKIGALTLDFAIRDKKTNKPLNASVIKMTGSSGETIPPSASSTGSCTYKLPLNNTYSLKIKSDGFEEYVVDINTNTPASKSAMRHFFGEPIVLALESSVDRAKTEFSYSSKVFYDAKLGSFTIESISSKRAKTPEEPQANKDAKTQPVKNDKADQQKAKEQAEAAKEKAAAELASAKARQEKEMKDQAKERDKIAEEEAKAKLENLDQKQDMSKEVNELAGSPKTVAPEPVKEESIHVTQKNFSIDQASKAAEALRAAKRAEAAKAAAEKNKRTKHEGSNPYGEILDAIKSAPLDRSTL